jgi:hypothetical protein
VSAVLANIWFAFEKNSEVPPTFLLTQTEHGTVALTLVADSLLLALVGEEDALLGSMKLKAMRMADALTEPLSRLVKAA